MTRVEARGRQVDPLGVHRAELGVLDAELGRPRACELDHLRRRVGRDQRPAGRDELGREQARVAGARRELEHAVAGLRLDRVDEPARHRPRAGLEHRAVLTPAARGASPALQARVAVLRRVVPHSTTRLRDLLDQREAVDRLGGRSRCCPAPRTCPAPNTMMRYVPAPSFAARGGCRSTPRPAPSFASSTIGFVHAFETMPLVAVEPLALAVPGRSSPAAWPFRWRASGG